MISKYQQQLQGTRGADYKDSDSSSDDDEDVG